MVVVGVAVAVVMNQLTTAARVIRAMLDDMADPSDTRHGVFSKTETDSLNVLIEAVEAAWKGVD